MGRGKEGIGHASSMEEVWGMRAHQKEKINAIERDWEELVKVNETNSPRLHLLKGNCEKGTTPDTLDVLHFGANIFIKWVQWIDVKKFHRHPLRIPTLRGLFRKRG